MDEIFSKPDKIMLAMGLYKLGSLYQNLYLPLKKLCKKTIVFNTSKNLLFYGQDEMNQQLIESVRKERPDYIFFYFTYDEIYLETLIVIKKISPNTKIINFFSDDDTQYDSFSRYLCLFCDYVLIAQKQFVNDYKKEDIQFFLIPLIANTDHFKPLNLEKIYDVTFIGAMKENRADMIRFLKNQGVKIRVYGWHWDKTEEFKDIYQGIPDSEEMVKIINQSKINLSFTEGSGGILHIKGRVPEVMSCGSFLLTQHFSGYIDFFKEDKEIVTFKTKDELLKKINYYLKNEEEREKIATNAYKRMIKEYNLNLKLKELVEETMKDKARPIALPRINKTTISISEKEISLGLEKIKEKLKNFDYITFDYKNHKNHKIKNYFQSYSLIKTGKEISCCSYYVNSPYIGKYLFWFFDMNHHLNKEEFNTLLDLNQLTVTREFFINNFSQFERVFKGEKVTFINQENTAFISLGLVELNYLKTNNFDLLKKVFKMKFLHRLYSNIHQKKIISPFPFLLAFEALRNKSFIFKSIFEASRDKARKSVALGFEEFKI